MLCTQCSTNKARRRGMCDRCAYPALSGGTSTPAPVLPPVNLQVDADRAKGRLAHDLNLVRGKYAEALAQIDVLENERNAVLGLRQVNPCVIEPKHGSGTGEATLMVTASDWHLEERVEPAIVNGLNAFNLDIAQERVTTFFQAVVRLTRLLQQDVKIDTMIVALLGDFISGDIHEEVSEVCQLPPMEAVVFAQDRLVGGIDFLLEHTKLHFHFKCHSGNHARTTKTTRFATENGHSLEYLLYRHIAAVYAARGETRVTFDIAEGPHSYASIYGTAVRFQHGHMVKYGGGVGGIYIPVNKAIAQWNRGRHADLDVFGHFHQQVDGNNFLCNGSLIGYNSFALSIKAPYDVPKQTMVLFDKKRGRTCNWPILFKR